MKKIFISALLLGVFIAPSVTFAEVSEERREEIANMGVVGAVNRLQDEDEFPDAVELAFKEIKEGPELDKALDNAVHIDENDIERERYVELESRVGGPSRYSDDEGPSFKELSDEINGRNVASADSFESDDDEEE